MLKIKTPIKLKSYNNMCVLNDRFAKKIQANYELFPVHFTTEELLYLMQGNNTEQLIQQNNMTCIVNNDYYNNNINLEVDVINEFVNRFIEIINGKYTYQDRLYLDKFLIKAGIHNVNSFIKNAINYVNDTKELMNNVEFINDNRQFLSNVFKDFINNNNSRTELVNEYLNNNQQQILAQFSNRLFNHIISEDNKKLVALNTLYKKEYADISGIVNNLQYQKMELYKESMNQDLEFYANSLINMQYHINPYEVMWQDCTTKEKVLERLASAALLNIFDSMEIIQEKESDINIRFFINQRNNLSDIITSTVLRMISGRNINNQYIYENDYEEFKTLKKQQHSIFAQLVNRYESLQEQSKEYNIEQNIYTPEEIILHNNTNNNISDEELIYFEDNNIEENDIQTNESIIPKEIVKVQIDKEKAKKDILTALNNPMQVINEYNKETTKVELYHQKQKEMLYEDLPEDSRKLFERIDKILEKKAKSELQNMQESAEHSLFNDTHNESPLVTFEDYEILQLNEVEVNSNTSEEENVMYSDNESEYNINIKENNKSDNYINDYQIQVLKEALTKNIYTQSIYSLGVNPENSYKQFFEFCENKSEKLNITKQQTQEKFYESLMYVLDEYTQDFNTENSAFSIFANLNQFIKNNNIKDINNKADTEIRNISNTAFTINTENNNSLNLETNKDIYNKEETHLHNSENILIHNDNALVANESSENNVINEGNVNEYLDRFIQNNTINNVNNTTDAMVRNTINTTVAINTEDNNGLNFEVNKDIYNKEETHLHNSENILIHNDNTLIANKNNDNNIFNSNNYVNLSNEYSSQQYVEFIQEVLNVSERFFESSDTSNHYSFNSEIDLLKKEYSLVENTTQSIGNVSLYGDRITNQGDISFIYNNQQEIEEDLSSQTVNSNIITVENESYHNSNVSIKDSIKNSAATQYESTADIPQLKDAVENEIHRHETRIENHIQKNIERTIENQIANISEKVYTNLEKRLSMERKRRGY